MRFPARSWKSVRSCAFVGFSFGVLLWPQVRLMASQGGGYGARTMPTCGVYLVTGATDGIGRYTAELLVKQRHVVLVHGRSVQRVKDTVARLERLGGEAHGFVADLSLMSDVRKLAQEVSEKFPVLHGLLNNAGTFDGDYTGKRVVTSEGNEYSLAVNVMAPFLLSSLLMPTLKSSGSGRLIVTASMSAGYHQGLKDLQLEQGYSAHHAYSLSKLCDVMMVKEMDRRYGSPPQLCIHTLDPDPTSSWIDTKMLRAGWSSGGHPVSRATASFTMLTDEKYGKSSGICWGVGGGASAGECEKLWEDLVQLTGAEWP
ncbi:Retinol dehydrogenase 14 [Durusdinium trenchii]|uniref:Retinol dehydrogenase 14 n=2 Tax=Durusdinium trenchii TaxID=1381693 RepID=A0ABP0J689_9DINO